MYDNTRFHTDENYPAGLPAENAATHIGMYWAWAASQNLHNPVWQSAPESAEDFAAMQEGRLSGAEFLLRHMDGALMRDDFNEFGQRFTSFYYDDEEDGYGNFMADYVTTMNSPALGSFYHVADNTENRIKLEAVFQTAFEAWQQSLRPSS